MPQPLRVAVLGAGSFAEVAHLPGIQSHPNATVVALYSHNIDRARHLAATIGGIPTVTDDLPALLSRDDVDAVTVASSDDNHYHYTMAALNAGMPVYCEKPLAINVTQATEMTQTAESRRLLNFVGFIFRYTYCFQELRRRVLAGDIGTPYYVCVEWQSFANVMKVRPMTWRDAASGSGAGWVGEIGSHFVDAINWIVAPITEVCAIAHRIPRDLVDAAGNKHPHETLDFGTVLLRTRSGAQGQWTVSQITPSRQSSDFIEVVGEKGAFWASISRGQDEFLRVTRPGGRWEEVPLPPEALDHQPHAIFRMMHSFVDACLRGSIDPDQDANFAEGRFVQSALDQVVVSLASRRFELVQ